MDENEKIEERRGSAVWEFIKVVVISVVIVLPIRTYIAQPFIVSGASMEPNFYNGEYLIVDELTYELRPPQRGEVVVFRYPLNPSEFFIKRVIGLPGEKVEIKNGKKTLKRRASRGAVSSGKFGNRAQRKNGACRKPIFCFGGQSSS